MLVRGTLPRFIVRTGRLLCSMFADIAKLDRVKRFCSKCFNETRTRSRFLAGSDINYMNKDQLTRILLTHGIDSTGFEFFSDIQAATELIIEGDTIVQAVLHSSNMKETLPLSVDLPVSDWPDRKTFFLVKDRNGRHSIGGERPSSFQVPQHPTLKSNFIYLGSLDCTDPWFEWMRLERLHLAYPVYEGVFEVFLDYQDPNSPVVLCPETFGYSWIDDTVKGTDNVEYILQKYRTVNTVDLQDFETRDKDFLICGVPLWYQAPEIPRCPKSGEVMRFVMTINSDIDIKRQDGTGIDNLPFDDYLVFGDEGNLYVFYEPTSKVLCLNGQF